MKFTTSGDETWTATWGSSSEYYYDADAAMSDDTGPSEKAVLQTIVDIDSSETIKFYWKISSEIYSDYLEFYIDDDLQDGRITGDEDWAQQEHTIPSGIHRLRWIYNDGGGSGGDNAGWVDKVEWSGASAVPDSNNWQEIEYKYDVYGRRSEKSVDGYATRYVYEGGHVIAEYDGNNNLLRKYIYGPGVDKPVSMIEVADSNATYYYHYDALGSVVALSDSSGDTVQTYEYSAFGEVSVEDVNHTNPYMFAGRRYDIEIGLYYNRARYYNPYTGRFLQTDPIGYGDGINWYAYCGNNPLNLVDPSGAASITLSHGEDQEGFTATVTVGDESHTKDFDSFDDYYTWMSKFENGFYVESFEGEIGWDLSRGLTEENSWQLFVSLNAIAQMGEGTKKMINYIEEKMRTENVSIVFGQHPGVVNYYDPANNRAWWNTKDGDLDVSESWSKVPPQAMLAHELAHMYQDLKGDLTAYGSRDMTFAKWLAHEDFAIGYENEIRVAMSKWMPGQYKGIVKRGTYLSDDFFAGRAGSLRNRRARAEFNRRRHQNRW